GVFIVAWLVNALAPTFGGQQDPLRALKVTAYSFTPAWLGAVFGIIPMLGIVGALIGLYSLYLLYLGLPVLMRSPADKSLGYTVVTIIAAIVVWIVIGALTTCVGGLGMMGAGMMSRAPGLNAVPGRSSDRDTDAAAAIVSKMLGGKTDADRERMKDAMNTLQNLGAQADQAQRSARPSSSGDASASANVDMSAAMGAVGTMLAGGAKVDPVDFHKLKELLPESVAGMKRVEAEGQGGDAMGIKATTARGRYSDGARGQVTLEIADLGTLAGLAGLASRFDPALEKETDDGYERTRKVEGNLVHEQYNRRSRSGEMTVVLADRFLVTAHGDGVDADTIATTLKAVDYRKLAVLKAPAK
ncbi:MAG TPA: Yip1 family protein, partial [Casimicrobiaceae bacterium]|nr:Yip1 family protein [Casimicrobiaceae bacterium]